MASLVRTGHLGPREMSDRNCQEKCALLEFPLDLYAMALSGSEGPADYSHYHDLDETAKTAFTFKVQHRADELLFGFLPPPPCRILNVGAGLGITSNCYSVTSLSPSGQKAIIDRHGIGLDLNHTTYEDFSAPEESYDVILFRGSAKYVQSLSLFNKAHRLLAKNGILLIADEVGLRRSSNYDSYDLPLLSYELAQASRCGFELNEQVDLSDEAAADIDVLLSGREGSIPSWLSNHSITPNLWSKLQEYQRRYHDGHYGYVVSKFSKVQTSPRWQIAALRRQDREAVKTLFSEVFAPQVMSDALWEWKYGDNRGLGIVAWLGDKLVAHYAASTRSILYFGVPKLAAQICDVMVDRKERSRLRRAGHGVFALTAATFAECFMGYGALTELGFGFPTERAMKVAERLGLYAPVGKMVELQWSPTRGKPAFQTRLSFLQSEPVQRIAKLVDGLWNNMAPCFTHSLIGARDWRYVQHRYFSHPENNEHYKLLLISNRLTGKAKAMVVLCCGDDRCLIADFIGHVKYIGATVAEVRRMAALWGMKQVLVWITENFASVFPTQDAEQQDMGIQIPHSIWSYGVKREVVDGRWWLMAGDTELV